MSPFHHDVADFVQPGAILAQNAAHFGVAGYHLNPAAAPAHTYASDSSSVQLWRQRELVGQVANIDHIVEYNNWGSNDFRNARVVSAQENNPGPIARPGAGAFDVVSHDNLVVNGAAFARQQVLNAAGCNHLLAAANAAGGAPTHDGVANAVANPNQMTPADFLAVYTALPQE